MKKYTIFVVFSIYIIFSYADLYSQNFEIFKPNINFKGIIQSGNNIIAYGDDNNFMMTSNRGKSWGQYDIGEFGYLNKLIIKNEEIWGIFNNKILKSADNGYNWTITKLKLEENDSLLDITEGNNLIYLRSMNKIFSLDSNFNIINETRNPLIKSNILNWKGIKSLSGYGITYSNNSLLCDHMVDTINYKYKTVILSNDLKNIRILELDKYFKCKDCYFGGKYSYNNVDYYMASDSNGLRFIKANESFTKFDDLFTDKIYKQIYSTETSIYTLSVFNNNIYFLYFHPSDIWQGPLNNTDYGLKKYDQNLDSLINFGSLFYNKYYTVGNGRALSGINVNDKCIFIGDDSLIIMAGSNKNLIQSSDAGKNWTLISHFNKSPNRIINDNKIYSISPDHNEINVSNNGGLTFTPSLVPQNGGSLYELINPSQFNFDSSGKGIFIGAHPNGSKGTDFFNFGITSNAGKSFEFLSLSNIYIYENSKLSNILINKENFTFANSVNYKDLDYCHIYNFNMDTKKVELIKQDSGYSINYLLSNNFKNVLMFTTVPININNPNNVLEVRLSFDTCKSWKVINKIEKFLVFNQFYEHNPDSLFISCLNNNTIYLYDRKRNVFDTIFSDIKGNFANLQIIYIGNKFYIATDSVLYENTDKNDLTKWKIFPWQYSQPYFNNIVFKDNTMMLQYSDSLRHLDNYIMRIKGANYTNVEEKIETEKSFLYSFPPYPLPSREIVKTLIYFNSFYKIKDAEVKVYDIFGTEISSRGNIELTQLEPYSGEIAWDSRNVSSGTYFITVSLGNELKAIPVIISK